MSTDRTLDTAGQQLNALHDRIFQAGRTALDAAIEAGRILTEVKTKLQHGEWLPWLRDNVRFSKSTAYRYIELYERRDKFPIVGNLNDAYRLLADIDWEEKEAFDLRLQEIEETCQSELAKKAWTNSESDDEEDTEKTAAEQSELEEEVEEGSEEIDPVEIDKGVLPVDAWPLCERAFLKSIALAVSEQIKRRPPEWRAPLCYRLAEMLYKGAHPFIGVNCDELHLP